MSAYPGSEVWIDIDKTSSSLDTVVELLDAAGVVRATSDSSQLPATNTGAALANSKDTVLLAGPTATCNATPTGRRRLLLDQRVRRGDAGGVAGTVQTIPQLDTYYIRVRSRGATVAPADAGKTGGHYELRIRVNQRDEKPGSTVQFADIRYAINGIQAIGLPGHSPLLSESGEANDATNNNFNGALDTGNLLQTDRNNITVSVRCPARPTSTGTRSRWRST